MLTATGVGERPAAIGAAVVATIPLGCQIMRLAQVDDGELVRLLVGMIFLSTEGEGQGQDQHHNGG